MLHTHIDTSHHPHSEAQKKAHSQNPRTDTVPCAEVVRNTYFKKYIAVGTLINKTPAKESEDPVRLSFEGTGGSPWRGVQDKGAGGKVYYWRPDTGEWSRKEPPRVGVCFVSLCVSLCVSV